MWFYLKTWHIQIQIYHFVFFTCNVCCLSVCWMEINSQYTCTVNWLLLNLRIVTWFRCPWKIQFCIFAHKMGHWKDIFASNGKSNQLLMDYLMCSFRNGRPTFVWDKSNTLVVRMTRKRASLVWRMTYPFHVQVQDNLQRLLMRSSPDPIHYTVYPCSLVAFEISTHWLI